MTNKLVITTDEQKCEGCNKCISVCPIDDANIAYFVNGKNKIKIDPKKCIHCGHCIEFCDHNARQYIDDTERFIKKLQQGENISILVAPSFRINFKEYKKIFGFFKSLGVNLIYDVAFGAEIAAWIYHKLIKERNLKFSISQACPVVVNYIEKYQPNLIESLAPVHSPMMCSAIYLKKYQKCSEELAFISPCIGKIDEINDINTQGLIKYNVTYKKLQEYIQNNNIDINKYEEKDYDIVAKSLGVIFSKPGGLRENMEMYIKDAWIEEMSGQNYIYDYLEEYEKRLVDGQPKPNVLDILNCKHGCNIGTATNGNISVYDIGHVSSNLRNEKLDSKIEAINEIFNNNIRVHDFIRHYTDLSKEVVRSEEPSEMQYQAIFHRLHKYTKEDQNVNCFSCGYSSCRSMAKAIYNNINYPGNCIYYNKNKLYMEVKEKKTVLEELEYIAFNDQLTNLANRRSIYTTLEDVIEKAKKNNRKVGILFIDLDKFKMINDILGHIVGDHVLKIVSNRLKSTIGENHFIGRFGGDEFIAIIDNIDALGQIKNIAKRVVKVLQKPFFIKERQIYITCSVGICLYPDNGDDIKTLLKNADISMYKVKEKSGNSFEVYDDEINSKIQKQFNLLESFRIGIQKKEFILFYQPKVDMKTGAVSGFEALVRWNHPKMGLVAPNEFITVAEEMGLIQELDEYVIELACHQIKQWISMGIEPMNISVNISANLFNDNSFEDKLNDIISKTNIDPSLISIEITETAAMKNIKYAQKILKSLRKKGITILLDDFGKGYSSLNYLKEFPIDILKIDKLFVDKICTDKVNTAIMEAIINMAKVLKIRIVAEGVETIEQFNLLKDLGCDHYQGYLFSKPVPPEEAKKMLL